MKKDNKICIAKIQGKEFPYPSGTSYERIASDFQKNFPHRILLAVSGGRLQELNKTLKQDAAVSFVTGADRPGQETYRRSAVLLMLKAFSDVCGTGIAGKIIVDFSVGRSLYCRMSGEDSVDAEILSRVEKRMRELSAAKLPIEKRNIHTEEAIRLFHNSGMTEKERLLRFRISSRINVYTLDGFTDYFYGYMVPDTSYVAVFALEQYEGGFILRLPTIENPESLEPVNASKKVFRAMYESTMLLEKLGLGMTAGINETVASGRSRETILCQEALTEKRIGDCAQLIAGRKNVRCVMIAGPSSSGKTTFSRRLATQLHALGIQCYPIEVDNYFRNREDTPRDGNGDYDYECLGAMDVEKFNADMLALMRGERVRMPRYNFVKGEREYTGQSLQIGPEGLLIIEGIHCLNDEMTASIPAENKFRIYISCLTQMNIDEHNRIPTTDARLLRRMIRDARTRGNSAQETIRRWPSVVRGEQRNIYPYQDQADIIFNSALIYETSVLKTYIEPLLYGIPTDSPEEVEAKRLLKFLSYFLAIPSDDVPATSILREFIGGGCYGK